MDLGGCKYEKIYYIIYVNVNFKFTISGMWERKAECTSSSLSNAPGTEKEKVIIGIDDKFAPMGFRDENNNIVGFDIDYARAATEEMGVEVEFQPIDWSTKESELSSGRIDLIWNGYTILTNVKKKCYLLNLI